MNTILDGYKSLHFVSVSLHNIKVWPAGSWQKSRLIECFRVFSYEFNVPSKRWKSLSVIGFM